MGFFLGVVDGWGTDGKPLDSSMPFFLFILSLNIIFVEKFDLFVFFRWNIFIICHCHMYLSDQIHFFPSCFNPLLSTDNQTDKFSHKGIVYKILSDTKESLCAVLGGIVVFIFRNIHSMATYRK